MALARRIALAAATVAALAIPAPAQAAEPDLAQAVSTKLVAQFGSQARATYQATALETMVEPKRSERGWVFGGSIIRVPSNAEGSPITALFLAQKKGQSWTVTLEGSPEFAAAAAKAAPVLDPSERQLFANATPNATAAPEALAATGLGLPWKLGQGWGHWGVHGNSGTSTPYNSIDFYGGDGRVLASRAGKMYRFCTSGTWPFIKVVHDNGYTTGYYHLRNTTTKGDGSDVVEGEYLGQIDVQLPCGGSANGNHVHWTLWQGNTAVTVVGKTIGGWTWYAGSSAYQGYGERNGVRIYRDDCCRIINYGSGDTPPGYPTGTVDAGTYSSVNVRSGPGTSYAVLRTVSDGTVIQIACTARGSTVTGPLGTTDLWDRMPDGGYLSDAFVDTGTSDPVAPAC